MCLTCRVRTTRILYAYNSSSDRSDEIPRYNSNYVPFPLDMTPPFGHFYSVTLNSNLNFTENHFSRSESKPVPLTFDSVFLPTCLNAQNGCKKSKAYKTDKPWLAGWLEDLDPWLRVNPQYFTFALKASFLGQLFIFWTISDSLQATGITLWYKNHRGRGGGLLTGYHWDT